MVARNEQERNLRRETLLGQVEEVKEETRKLMERAREMENSDLMLRCIQQRAKQIELFGRATGEFIKEKQNPDDVEMRRSEYEKAIEIIIEDCKAEGIEISRIEAIQHYARVDSEILKYVH